jgi:hypothetical protein
MDFQPAVVASTFGEPRFEYTQTSQEKGMIEKRNRSIDDSIAFTAFG